MPGVDVGCSRGPDDRRTAQAAGLRHRPVRQEPPRRPEQVPADRARVRRVLRQPVSPQRRGRTRARGLSDRRRVPRLLRRRSCRAACIHSWATDEDSAEADDRYGPVGKQTHRGHRPADQEADGDHRRRDHRARASTSSAPARGRHAVLRVDEHDAHALPDPHQAGEHRARPGRWQSPYHDTMIDHDRNVGQLLDLVDELGIAEDTIVIYSTDNGPHANTWPDGATTPFRSEKNTNWEGAFRMPEMIRWPGKIKPGVGVQRDRPASRLAADVPGGGGRARHRREAQEGPQGQSGEQDLQGPHRRLQPAAVPDRRGGQEPAQAG